MADGEASVVIRDYEGLREALRARCEAVGISRATLDDIAGLQDGYSGKLLGPGANKFFGVVSLGAVLGALGCKLVLVEDPDAVARVRRRWVPRDERHVTRRPRAAPDRATA